jgi:hypothetical protein
MMMQEPGDINEIQMDASTELPTDPISKPSAWWPFRANSGFAKLHQSIRFYHPEK